ncbi:hypothetical protein JOC85_002689 [Bacillus mesophilus]|uniref:Uncharacterized protein n=1 Tax=Bacillus mesophilus TaxID=1808955 RepID=A0A6M0Q8Q3_9BACI|nr:hypothetical protein [Bacillus mesophilus]MBM7661882.1 hypothetical protein [Bacillus mesophilus]NEY72756.1 hypothetical protein [Bacillus mesophilus]
MEKSINLSVNQLERTTSNVTRVEQHSSFDEIMEKITNGMFNVILFGGIPYFLWIFIQFMMKG